MHDHRNAAMWRRVSTWEQANENQAPAVEMFATHHRYNIVKTYALDDSAWKSNAESDKQYRRVLTQALDDAWRGEFQTLIIWSLDRLTRGGAEDALRLIRKFRERGVVVVSVQEPWLNGSPEVQDVLVAFAGWMAQQESTRKSERIKAGLERRKALGLPVGRQPGAKDRRPRRRAGYVARWDGERGHA
jgi:DNA invertase Pin-like site-specific DNA recombinase